jgi:uncharacterized protein YdeI (YjbR/CyaY-like superfamily)
MGAAERHGPGGGVKPKFFQTPAAFRAWLERHHDTTDELLVGFYRKDSGRPSITWPESVDAALCFGWIDGVRRRIDEQSYSIRFTPRRRGSIWSAVNIRRMAELDKQGLVHEAGAAAFARRSAKKSGIYSYEQRADAVFGPTLEKRFRANRKAWAFFQAQPPGYRKQMTYRVATAKLEATRLKRLDALIEYSARGERML